MKITRRPSVARRGAWAVALVLGVLVESVASAGPAEPARIEKFPVWSRPAWIMAQTARRRRRNDWIWTYLMYAGIAAVVAGAVGGVLFLAKKQAEAGREIKPESSREAHAATADMVGDYRLLTLLMTGQTSQVWEATEVSSGRHFAIKMLLPEYAANREHRALLFNEAEVGKTLAHENIIRIVHLDKSWKTPHFVMDFFPGGNLKQRVLHKDVEFIKEHLHSILKQTVTALAFMHAKGWVHRDIKPDNIMVNSNGEVRLIDFAITKRIPTGWAKRFHRKGRAQGTRSYMSPEQIRDEPLDGRADIYSLGATIYELITGRPPFRAADAQTLLGKHLSEKPVPPNTINPDVTDEFSEFVLKMLAKKREERPANCHEILMALRKLRLFKSEGARKVARS
jgi:serine/threonine protein kinase